MNNGEKGGPSPEEMGLEKEEVNADGLTEYEQGLVDQWLAQHQAEAPAESELRDCEPEIAELLSLIEAFKNKHSLEELNKIIDLTPGEAPHHPIRQPAKEDLPPMLSLLRALKQETNITDERYEEVQAEYKVVSDAVGRMSNNKLTHS